MSRLCHVSNSRTSYIFYQYCHCILHTKQVHTTVVLKNPQYSEVTYYGGVAFCYSGFSISTHHYLVTEEHRGGAVFWSMSLQGTENEEISSLEISDETVSGEDSGDRK